MPRLPVLAFSALLLVPAIWRFAGGWAVVSVEHLPDYAVAGKPLTLTFTVLQHGVEPLKGLRPVVEARSGRFATRATAAAGKESGQYIVSVDLPEPGDWGLTIHSGFGESRLKLLPLRAIAASAQAPAPLTDAERGRQLFAAKGCVTCHVKDDPDSEGYLDIGPPLKGKHFEGAWLKQFLANPASMGPARYGKGMMPNLGLKQAEIASLSAYLNDGK